MLIQIYSEDITFAILRKVLIKIKKIMRKNLLIFAFVVLLGFVGLAQPQLSWQFANFEVTNAGAELQFDVQVKADVASTYHRDLQVYFDYNTAGFGSSVVSGGHITVTPGPLMDSYYSIVNTVDNTSSKVAIITEADNEFTDVGSAAHFNLMPDSFTTLFHVSMDIVDNTVLAGISFDEALMNGGQYYQNTAAVQPVKYADPSVYVNGLNDKLSTAYGVITYANSASTPMSDVTVNLMDGATLVSSSTSNSNGEYYLSGIDDGTYTFDNTTAKAWGGVNGLDAILVARYLAGLYPLTPFQQKAADVTESGAPNGLDRIMIKRRIAGATYPAWSAPDFIFEDSSVTVNNGVGTVNFQSLCSGDVNGSYTPPAK